MKHAIGYMALAALLAAGESALAQDMPAYETGVRLAQRRGYDNADCYGRVFAKYAVVVENPNGRRSWFAASTPAYNAEQQRRCGVDRLGDLRQRRQQSAPVTSQYRGGAYQAGLRIAAARGYSGPAAACFARVFANQASVGPSSLRAGQMTWGAYLTPSIRGEMHRQCGISV
ncbi:hypothetical protein [Bosea sp. (in: a-proteobacteria)]|jgi:hypothetical protein|uniref:hypothetical protein n=1 Tax=Bosea sp. (in: a-proteobacteria) TaxID=1871050 RepID=UPI002DDDAF06|nr:hypothetical protein [Bosea sp. (in: a-proteobacteria)]HEV2513366.1 hypothetical protein [Bosea sp. (in: a-proteobacteria)]